MKINETKEEDVLESAAFPKDAAYGLVVRKTDIYVNVVFFTADGSILSNATFDPKSTAEVEVVGYGNLVRAVDYVIGERPKEDGNIA